MRTTENQSASGPQIVSFRERQSYKRLVEAFAARLKLFRLHEHLSVEELAQKSGVSIDRIKAFEDGSESPYFEEVLVLAPAYKLPLAEIARVIEKYYDDFIADEARALK